MNTDFRCGHKRTGPNTYRSTGYPRCRQCYNAYHRQRRRKEREGYLRWKQSQEESAQEAR